MVIPRKVLRMRKLHIGSINDSIDRRFLADFWVKRQVFGRLLDQIFGFRVGPIIEKTKTVTKRSNKYIPDGVFPHTQNFGAIRMDVFSSDFSHNTCVCGSSFLHP